MAPQKRKAETYDKSDPFVADDDDNDGSSPAPAPKRTKNAPSSNSHSTHTSTSTSSTEMKKDEDGNNYWEISKARRVTISEFKGKRMISIREYYEKDGKWLPGKKGITMTVEQYSTLLTVMPQIEAQLVDQGENVPRPQYDGGPVGRDDASEVGSAAGSKKANIEATSDEDEGD